MQNQKLAQSFLSLKEQTNRENLSYIPQKNLTDQSKNGNGNYLNGNNPLSGQEQLIQNILGYPVTQVILDEQGDIILDIGDLITYQAVERAIKANVFTILVNAAYIKK